MLSSYSESRPWFSATPSEPCLNSNKCPTGLGLQQEPEGKNGKRIFRLWISCYHCGELDIILTKVMEFTSLETLPSSAF